VLAVPLLCALDADIVELREAGGAVLLPAALEREQRACERSKRRKKREMVGIKNGEGREEGEERGASKIGKEGV
jgi:hypothetical protein